MTFDTGGKSVKNSANFTRKYENKNVWNPIIEDYQLSANLNLNGKSEILVTFCQIGFIYDDFFVVKFERYNLP